MKQFTRTAIFPGLVRPLNLREIFLRIPEQALGLIDFYEDLMRGPSPLTPGERELIYSYGSKAAGCHFCHTSHRHCAIGLGIPEKVFSLEPDQLPRAQLRQGMAALLCYTTDLIVGGSARLAGDSRITSVMTFDRESLIDAILVAGLTAYINRIIEGLGAFSDDAQHAHNGAALARGGYGPVREEVARSLAATGFKNEAEWPEAVDPVPAGLQSRSHLLHWLQSYQRLVSEGPSRIPVPYRKSVFAKFKDASGSHDLRGSSPDKHHLNEPAYLIASAFVERLIEAPVASSANDIEQLYAVGFDERDVIDLVVLAATVALKVRIDIGLNDFGLNADATLGR